MNFHQGIFGRYPSSKGKFLILSPPFSAISIFTTKENSFGLISRFRPVVFLQVSRFSLNGFRDFLLGSSKTREYNVSDGIQLQFRPKFASVLLLKLPLKMQAKLLAF